MTRLLVTAASALALLVGIGATAPAAEAAGARCGMTIRGKVKLTQDLSCYGQKPPKLLGPNAHLDLNGHTLTCGDVDTDNPLKMLGQGTLLRNGELYECTIQMLDRGGHRLRNVRNYSFNHLALLIRSDSNEVVYSSIGADDGAAHMSGNYNLLSDNSIGADASALTVVGNRNVIVHNHFGVVADGGAALGISGNLNRVYGNSTLEGCISSSGFGNIIEGNFEDPEFCPELDAEG